MDGTELPTIFGMSAGAFVVLYFTLVLGGACLASFYNQRSAFLLLFSLTLVSIVLVIIGGAATLFGPLVGMGLAALAMVLQTGDLGAVVGPLAVGGVAVT